MEIAMLYSHVGLATLTIATMSAIARADPPDEQRRAGYPLETSRFAQPSDTGRYTGGTIGGGVLRLRKSDRPLPNEGTWGWDYTGGLFQRRVFLGWWHGRRYQGGSGAYQTDGPHILHPLEK
jgi:hypothetical protein